MNLQINFDKKSKRIKPMQAVNNGPTEPPSSGETTRNNYLDYVRAKIPFARTHDSSFSTVYDGPHTIDVMEIFRNFDADPYDPASYDFVHTDAYVKWTIEAGTEIFYRLGHRIEHERKKYGTLVPKDFQKWAVICEHIIRHLNEGWGNGYHFGIRYWEIWNEPDLDPDDAKNKRTWGGTKAEFFEFYEVAAKHLKSTFPDLLIGGPAVASVGAWSDEFLAHCKATDSPLDFFSWHIYAHRPTKVVEHAKMAREMLDKYGYTDVESICNEWNYVRDWRVNFRYTIDMIHSIKGAAFVADVMLRCQASGLVDMLMYYDARPGTYWNGLFDLYHFDPQKPYYVFPMFSTLYRLGHEVELSTDDDEISAVAAVGDGKGAVMLAYYCHDDDANASKIVSLSAIGASLSPKSLLRLDVSRDAQIEPYTGGEIAMMPNSVILVNFES